MAFHSKSLGMSRPCISYVNICYIILLLLIVIVIIIIIVVVVVAAASAIVVVFNNNNNNNNNNNKKFTICCLSTRRRHSQVRKDVHGPPKQSMLVRRESLVPPNGKTREIINYVCQSWSEHLVVRHCWTMKHITVRLSHHMSGQFWACPV